MQIFRIRIFRRLALLMLVLLAAVVFLELRKSRQHKDFVSRCSKLHDEFECEALWGQANQDTSVIVVPTFIAPH